MSENDLTQAPNDTLASLLISCRYLTSEAERYQEKRTIKVLHQGVRYGIVDLETEIDRRVRGGWITTL
jgi:hypothetical protein